MDRLNLVEGSVVSMASRLQRLQEESRLNLSCLEERLDSLMLLLLGILSGCKLSCSDSVLKMSIQDLGRERKAEEPPTPLGFVSYWSLCQLLLLESSKKSEQTFPWDCAEIHKQRIWDSGIYTIQPIPLQHPFEASCDMVTHGDGWTVFQCRQDGSLDFNRTWQEYRLGFGSLQGEPWLGNKQLCSLTRLAQHALCMELEEWYGIQCHTTYHTFRGASEANKYS